MPFVNLLGPNTEDEAINRWVYARTAEKMGVVVDNTAVNDLLKFMTAGADPQKLITDVLGVVREMNEAELFNGVREQILALRLMQLGHQYDDWAGLSASPGERWNYFKRLHQQATIEVAVLSPKDYVKEVKDPPAEDLKKFFEEHKDAEASPESPTPGFRVPHKVNIEYLEADPESYDKLITEAEIRDELKKHPEKYARNKEEFEKQEKDERDARAKEEKEAAGKAAAENTEKKPAGETKKNESKPEEKGPAKTEQKPETKPETKSEPKADAKPDANTAPAPAKPAATAAKPAGTWPRRGPRRSASWHLLKTSRRRKTSAALPIATKTGAARRPNPEPRRETSLSTPRRRPMRRSPLKRKLQGTRRSPPAQSRPRRRRLQRRSPTTTNRRRPKPLRKRPRPRRNLPSRSRPRRSGCTTWCAAIWLKRCSKTI